MSPIIWVLLLIVFVPLLALVVLLGILFLIKTWGGASRTAHVALPAADGTPPSVTTTGIGWPSATTFGKILIWLAIGGSIIFALLIWGWPWNWFKGNINIPRPNPMWIFPLLLLVAAIGYIITSTAWKKPKFYLLAGVALIAAFFYLGGYVPTGGMQQVATDPCDMEGTLPYTFGTSPTAPIDRGGKCSKHFWHEGHCLYFTQAGSSKRLGPYCGGVYPPFIENAWSADSEFQGRYQFYVNNK